MSILKIATRMVVMGLAIVMHSYAAYEICQQVPNGTKIPHNMDMENILKNFDLADEYAKYAAHTKDRTHYDEDGNLHPCQQPDVPRIATNFLVTKHDHHTLINKLNEGKTPDQAYFQYSIPSYKLTEVIYDIATTGRSHHKSIPANADIWAITREFQQAWITNEKIKDAVKVMHLYKTYNDIRLVINIYILDPNKKLNNYDSSDVIIDALENLIKGNETNHPKINNETITDPWAAVNEVIAIHQDIQAKLRALQ